MFEGRKKRKEKKWEAFLEKLHGKGPAIFLAAFIAICAGTVGIGKVTEGKTFVWEIQDRFADPYK